MTWEQVKTWTVKREGGHLRHRDSLRKASEVDECRILLAIMKRLALLHREGILGNEWEAGGGR